MNLGKMLNLSVFSFLYVKIGMVSKISTMQDPSLKRVNIYIKSLEQYIVSAIRG